VMMLLWEEDNQTVGQLGARLNLDSGTLSPLLKRLTAAGLVTRHRRVEDERSVAIALTEQGRSLRERGLAINQDMLCTLQLDQDDFGALKSQLEVLIDRVGTAERPVA
jgi:MarR family transcriptional regulator, organic hydroperoxide resistance regulator